MGIGEIHLVELGLTRDLAQRTNLHAFGMHVHSEVRHTLVLGRIGVGPGHQHPPISQMRHGVPHLLPVDQPLITIAYRLAGQPGEITACARLREQLTPALFTGEHGSQEASLLLVGAMRDNGGPGQCDEECGGVLGCRSGFTQSTLHRAIEVRSQTEPAESHREVNPGQAGVVTGPTECDVVHGGGIKRSEQGRDGGLHRCLGGEGFGGEGFGDEDISHDPHHCSQCLRSHTETAHPRWSRPGAGPEGQGPRGLSGAPGARRPGSCTR